MDCINKSHPKWKELIAKYDEFTAIEKFIEYVDRQKLKETSNIKPGVQELFDSNFVIFAESKTSDEVINKLLTNKVIDKKCS